MSVVTAMPVFFTLRLFNIASRTRGRESLRSRFGNCTHANGKSVPQRVRQSSIRSGNWTEYRRAFTSLDVLCSPWYQIAPRRA